MIEAITGVVLIFMAITLSRPVTTFIHELGHALPALLFTKGPVVIYVGSYGDTSNSTTTTLGRLTIIFKYRLMDWQLGLCRHKVAPRVWEELLIILGGPLFSLLIAIGAGLLLQSFKEEQYIAFVIGIFLTSGILDFFVNVIPSKSPLEMHDGALTYNDGAQFLQVLKSSRYPESYFEALQLLEEEREEEAIEKLKLSIEQGVHDLSVYQFIINLLRKAKQNSEAISFHQDYGSFFKLSSADWVVIGRLHENADQKLKAISLYGEAIRLNYMNIEALRQRGKLLLELGYEEKGNADLKKVAMMTGEELV